MGGEWEIEVFNVDEGGWRSLDTAGFSGRPRAAMRKLAEAHTAHPECGALRLVWRPAS